MTTLDELREQVEAAKKGHGASSHWDYVYKRLDALENAVLALLSALEKESAE